MAEISIHRISGPYRTSPVSETLETGLLVVKDRQSVDGACCHPRVVVENPAVYGGILLKEEALLLPVVQPFSTGCDEIFASAGGDVGSSGWHGMRWSMPW